MSIERLRASFAQTGHAHLNNAGVAPCSLPAIAAVQEAASAMSLGTAAMPRLIQGYDAARATFARLVGAKTEDVSMMPTRAVAISQLALGLPLEAGDEIVTWDQEYPSNAYPWYVAARKAGGRVVVVPSEADLRLDTDRLIAAIGARTRVVALSWVQYQTGAVTDLARVSEACRKVGALLAVDAIQGLGVMPFDMTALGVDAVTGGTQKWLAGPMGHGFLALRPGLRDLLEPIVHGAMTYGTFDDLTDPSRTPRHDPLRFEPGSPLLFGALGGAAAIEVLLDVGIDAIHAEALRLAAKLREGLLAHGARLLSAPLGDAPSPITTFLPRGDVGAAARRLSASKTSYALRAGGIRLAPHAFNTDDDIARAIEAIAASPGG